MLDRDSKPIKRTEQSIKLYYVLLDKGYPESFAKEISLSLNTDWTANRMLGYISKFNKKLPLEEIADETLAILSDRQRIVDKKKAEYYNSKYNEYLNVWRYED